MKKSSSPKGMKPKAKSKKPIMQRSGGGARLAAKRKRKPVMRHSREEESES